MAIVDDVKARVQRILQSKDLLIELKGDDFWVPYGSTRCRIMVRPYGDGHAIVDVSALVVADVPVTTRLKEYLADKSSDFMFGNLELYKDGAKGMIIFRHALLGDYLDEDELMFTVAAVAGTADDLDDEVRSTFGGKRAVD